MNDHHVDTIFEERISNYSHLARKYAGKTYIMKLVEAAEIETKLPIAVHLDHGPDFEMCKAVIDDGFTSVMIDGSHETFEKNIKRRIRLLRIKY